VVVVEEEGEKRVSVQLHASNSSTPPLFAPTVAEVAGAEGAAGAAGAAEVVEVVNVVIL